MLALYDLPELGARARIRTPVLSSQCWILLIKWHLIITIMRSSLLFNYILLVAANPPCGNPSTCFLRLAGTQRFRFLPYKWCVSLASGLTSAFSCCGPGKAELTSVLWAVTLPALTSLFKHSGVSLILWTCGIPQRLLTPGKWSVHRIKDSGAATLWMLQRCWFLGCKPEGGSLLQRGWDMMGSGSVQLSLALYKSHWIPSLNHSSWESGAVTFGKICCFLCLYCYGRARAAFIALNSWYMEVN